MSQAKAQAAQPAYIEKLRAENDRLRSLAEELASACRLLANVQAYGEIFPKGVLPARDAARAALVKWEAVK